MFVLTMGVISSQMRRGRGKRKGQVTVKRALIINTSVDVRMGKLSAPWASSWVDGIDPFPPGWQCGFSYGCREEGHYQALLCARVKLATDPPELANHRNSQPVLHHPAAVYIIRQTARPTTRSRCSAPDGVDYLPRSSPGAAQSTPTRGCFFSMPLGKLLDRPTKDKRKQTNVMKFRI